MAQATPPDADPPTHGSVPGAALPVSPPEILEDPLLAAVPVVDGAKRLGTCILTAKLGQGGMGAVYRGFHTRLNTAVAVKILPFHLASGPNADAARQRFHREAQLAVQLDHPNLIRVMDVDESDQRMYYLIMEYVEGQTVGAALRRNLEKHNRPLPERTAASVLAQVASALAYAHQKGIIHRDIKPDNIMIRKDDGRVKVMDLGLAKSIDADEGVSMTSQGMGSPHYMSPEQASDAKHVTDTSDVYAMGATLYHLVTGHTPFQAPSIYALVKKMHDEPPDDPRTYNPGLSEELRAVILRCLEKDPAKRYSAADFLKALRAIGDRLPTTAPVSPAAATVSATAQTMPSTATVASPNPSAVPVPGASTPAQPTQTAPVKPAARKPAAQGPTATAPAVRAPKAAPPPAAQPAGAPRRALFVALGAVGGLVFLALLAFLWARHTHAVEAEARAKTVDGILQQIQPRLAVKDYDQAAALYKTIPPDADPEQVAATRQAVTAGVARRADERAFLQTVDGRIHQLFAALGDAPDRPVVQPTTQIAPVDPQHDLTPQLTLLVNAKPGNKVEGLVHPDAWSDLKIFAGDSNTYLQLQTHFHDRAGLLGFLDVLNLDLHPGEQPFNERLVRLSQGRFSKLYFLLQQKGEGGTVADGTELQVNLNDQGEIKLSGHSIHLPDIAALLREMDGNADQPGPRPRPGPGERPDRKTAQKFSGSARLIAQPAAAGAPAIDGFSRLLKVLEAVGGKPEPNFPDLAREFTETIADLRLNLDQAGRMITGVDFTAAAAPQNGLTVRASATAENRIAYQMLERQVPKILFILSLDPKNINLVKIDREADPAKLQSAVVLNFNNAGVQKILKDMWNDNPYNKQP